MNSLCLNRISKDLKEITKSPIEGIGIVSLDNDPKKYVVNMKIMNGIFEGYCLQLLLTFSDNYPIKPPRILIYPGQGLDNSYHHHVFKSDIKDEKGNYFYKFCFDLLENDFMPTSSVENTGWNPSYTISTLLLQVQTFLSNPDFHNYVPNKEKIDELMKSMNNYEKTFIIKNEKNEEIIKVHTWKDPYPEMYFAKNSMNMIDNKLEENKIDDKLNLVKEDLTCYISRLNFIDNRNIILGYPIQRLKNGVLIPIPEILSYDCFIEESSKNDSDNRYENFRIIPFHDFNFNINNNIDNNMNNIDDDINLIPNLFQFNVIRNFDLFRDIQRRERRERIPFFNSFYDEDINYSIDRNFGNLYKSANNEFYNSWLPIFINDENFEKNKITILNYFSIVKFGNSGLKQFDFQPQYIFEILINLLSGMIFKIVKDNISSSFMKCFFQYIFMFKKLQKIYNNNFIEYQKLYFEEYINDLNKPKSKLTIKQYIKKDFYELLTLFLLSDNDMKQVINTKENYIAKYKNFIFLKLFENGKIDEYILVDSLIKDLKKFNLFDEIFHIIIFYLYENFFSTRGKLLCLVKYDKIKDKLKNMINKMKFINFYHSLNSKIKQKINILLFTKLNFSDYVNDFRLNLEINDVFYFFNNRYKIASKLDILRTKIFSENVFDKLEENFGIYFDSANLIEELKTEIKIKNKKKFFKNNDFIPLIELNIYYSIYKICNERWSSFIDFNFFTNYFEESLYKELVDIFYSYKKKKINKIREIKINEKESIKRKKIAIKNNYDKINNARLNKYINKKNITRLLLCKRNHY